MDRFVSLASGLHRQLAGGPISEKNKAALIAEAQKPDWTSYAWGDRAGALYLSFQMALARKRAGQIDKNPWLYALKAAPSYLVEAADINATNRVALEVDDEDEMPVVPLRWHGGDT